MNDSEQFPSQSLDRWLIEVEEWAREVEVHEREFRRSCMFLDRLPPNWYAVTEAMISIEASLRVIRDLLTH